MVKNQNWQRRVETAEARRLATKQRKEQKQMKRSNSTNSGGKVTNKSMVSDLLRLLDRYSDKLLQQNQQKRGKCVTLHIWTESLPADGSSVQHILLEEQKNVGSKNKRRSRSSSLNKELPSKPSPRGSENKGERRSRSSSFNCRSENTDNESVLQMRLCSNDFFGGASRNDGSKKKCTNCKFAHYSSKYETLASILNKNSGTRDASNYSKECLALSATAAMLANTIKAKHISSDNQSADIDSIDMLYHIPIEINVNHENDISSNNGTLKISETVKECMLKKNITVENIIYVALNSVLIYDRHRNGLVLSDNSFMVNVIGIDNTNNNSSSNARRYRARTLSFNDNEPSDIINRPRTLSFSNSIGRVAYNNESSNNSNKDFDQNYEGYDYESQVQLQLPAPILENILSFLSDMHVSIMMKVCVDWYLEIGQTSPSLWKNLLQRHGWKLPVLVGAPLLKSKNSVVIERRTSSVSDCNDDTLTDLYRKQFITHYSVIRSMKAVQMAISTLWPSSRSSSKRNNEMVVQDFTSRRKAPQPPNCCVSIKVWKSNRVVAAYTSDCTVRLFEAVEKPRSYNYGGGDSTPGKSYPPSHRSTCREIATVLMAPYKNTKKRTCRLLAMDTDDVMIGCLCHVMDNTNADGIDEEGGKNISESFYLTTMTREDFLCSSIDDSDHQTTSHRDHNNEAALQKINIGESVINYLISCDDIDHRLLHLYDYLAQGGEISKVEILTSQSVVACGRGRFMVEVTISIPNVENFGNNNNDDDDDDEFDRMILLDRKVLLFSSLDGAILWIGNSNPTLVLREEDLVLSCRRNAMIPANDKYSSDEGNDSKSDFSRNMGLSNMISCSVVIASSTSPTIMSVEIESSGYVKYAHEVIGSNHVRNELLQFNPGWEILFCNHRPVCITLTAVVAIDNLIKTGDGDDGNTKHMCVASFYRRNSITSDNTAQSVSTIEDSNDTMSDARDEAYSMLTLEGDCEGVRMECINDDYVVIICRVNQDAGGGHHRQSQLLKGIFAILIHVPTRQEIKRLRIDVPVAVVDRNDILHEFPVFFASSGDTIGVGIWSAGIMLTGQDVRNLVYDKTKLGDHEGNGSLSGNIRRNKKNKKKKRHQPSNKGSRKDRFTRGLSLTG